MQTFPIVPPPGTLQVADFAYIVSRRTLSGHRSIDEANVGTSGHRFAVLNLQLLIKLVYSRHFPNSCKVRRPFRHLFRHVVISPKGYDAIRHYPRQCRPSSFCSKRKCPAFTVIPGDRHSFQLSGIRGAGKGGAIVNLAPAMHILVHPAGRNGVSHLIYRILGMRSHRLPHGPLRRVALPLAPGHGH